jgi:hypothetical protein
MEIIKVVKADYINGYKIALKFSDGKENIVDLKDELWGEVFEPLKDINYFKSFTLNPFTIEWENGADFSPEFLYELGEVETRRSEVT